MLGIVVVNYKTIDRTSQYVRQELTKIKTPHKVVIVNNGCTDEHNATLAQSCGAFLVPESGVIDTNSDLFVLGAKDNLGYAKGNNLGVEFLTKHFDIDYLLFSNNDILFKNDDVVEQLINIMKERPDVGMIGPSVVNLDGEKQNPYVRPSIWKLQIIPWLFMPLLIAIKKTEISNAVNTKAKEGCHYRLSGSFMLTRTDYFLKAGMFDPHTFLYCEEPILSERYLRVGLKTYYYDGVTVIHEHGYTSSRTHYYLQTKKIDLDSQLYYFKNYRSVSNVVIYLAKVSFLIYENIWYPFINYLLKIRDSRKKV